MNIRALVADDESKAQRTRRQHGSEMIIDVQSAGDGSLRAFAIARDWRPDARAGYYDARFDGLESCSPYPKFYPKRALPDREATWSTTVLRAQALMTT